jgi:hypothetical protein
MKRGDLENTVHLYVTPSSLVPEHMLSFLRNNTLHNYRNDNLQTHKKGSVSAVTRIPFSATGGKQYTEDQQLLTLNGWLLFCSQNIHLFNNIIILSIYYNIYI